MLEAFANFLWLIMQPCYNVFSNWWLAILLFTLIMKVALLPLALWVQKNAIKMVQLMPALNAIEVKYYGDRESIGEAKSKLFKERKYHPMLSIIPLAVQIIILFGLVEVMRSVTSGGAPGTEFLGTTPYIDGGASWLMPILAGISAIILAITQNIMNPLQREQTRSEKNFTNGLSIALSFVLGVFVSTGMAFYWICSNLTTIIVQWLCNIIIKPSKYIDRKTVAQSRSELRDLEMLDSKNRRKFFSPLSKRERRDYKRFFSIMNKHIVFCSEGSGFYKYFVGAIQYLLENSTANIHYITNDPDDQIFGIAQEQPRIKPYYIGVKKSITLMMKMDADIIITTQEDLDNFYIKRSYVRKDIEYIFMFHHMTSTHLTALEKSYDNFDTLLCVGPHQIKEIRKAEQLRNLPAKKLIECGYDLLDRTTQQYETLLSNGSIQDLKKINKPTILIAPSWQKDNILDTCIDELLTGLLSEDYFIIVRPHPEYTKRHFAKWQALQDRYKSVPKEWLYFEQDFKTSTSIHISDLLITDWSTIFCEYAFSSYRPSIFIDTPMKVGNKNWRSLEIEPTDISLRNQTGVSLSLENINEVRDTVRNILRNKGEWSKKIKVVADSFIFNRGNGGRKAGEYILSEAIKIQNEKGSEQNA